jgi:hypothetical protein
MWIYVATVVLGLVFVAAIVSMVGGLVLQRQLACLRLSGILCPACTHRFGWSAAREAASRRGKTSTGNVSDKGTVDWCIVCPNCGRESAFDPILQVLRSSDHSLMHTQGRGRFSFTLRDLIWLTVVGAFAAAWWTERKDRLFAEDIIRARNRDHSAQVNELRNELQKSANSELMFRSSVLSALSKQGWTHTRSEDGIVLTSPQGQSYEIELPIPGRTQAVETVDDLFREFR